MLYSCGSHFKKLLISTLEISHTDFNVGLMSILRTLRCFYFLGFGFCCHMRLDIVIPSLGRKMMAMMVAGKKNIMCKTIAYANASGSSIPRIPRRYTIANSNVPIAAGAVGIVVAKKVVPIITNVAEAGETGKPIISAMIHAVVPIRIQ